MEDLRIGRIERALRHRLHLRQSDLGKRVGVSQGEISLFERGRIEGMPIRTVRRILHGVDAELVLSVRWRGAELDQLLDAAHARLGEIVVGILRDAGWAVTPEVSFSIYGDRGSIDLLAWHPPTRTLLIIELKTEIASIEETLRRHDVKVRLARQIAVERFGWKAATVGKLLVLPEQRTLRRKVEAKAQLFHSVYPSRTLEVRRWLRAPLGPLDGLWFLSDTNPARGVRGRPVRRRVRTVGSRSDRAETRSRAPFLSPKTTDAVM